MTLTKVPAKVAVMQPYFLPYLPYWQLIHSCDTFVLLDDTLYRTRGWINRNRILVQDAIRWMTVPLSHGSQNRRIAEIVVSDHGDWRSRMLKTVERAYAKAPFQEKGMSYIYSILTFPQKSLDEFLEHSIRETMATLGITAKVRSARMDLPVSSATGVNRILEICEEEGAATYINPVRGAFLYDHSRFSERGIDLRFLEARWNEIDLRTACEDGPALSILDLLMWNDPQTIASFLDCFTLLRSDRIATKPAALVYG